MHVLASVAAGSVLALSLPLGSAFAAMPGPGLVAPVTPHAATVIRTGWDGHYYHHWHHYWHHEYREGWHHHWHHYWHRPYGYTY